MAEGERDRFETAAGIPLEEVYDEASLAGRTPPFDAARDLGRPGAFPFTRGIHASMYRGRPWTMRQYAGFGTAEATNQRFKFLLASGQTGLSVAFDLPTQMGHDADHPLARGEVGRTGVAISSIEDMHQLLDGLPLAEVSVSMTINATAATLLCLYLAVADERGVPRDKLAGTIQNDILKEYIARGTYIYPPAPSMRLVADTFAFCRDEVPKWNTISISGYHIREAGSDAVQEVAFTLADGIAYVDAARAAGLAVDAFAPRLSFFFNAHANLLEEVAKFRAARRLWARVMRDRFGARDPRAQILRFHAQTAGSTLTAVEPLNNVARTTGEALAAVLGGAYAVEALTSEIEDRARALIEEIDRRGGMVAAIEAGFPQREIERRAFEHQRAVESGARVVVGVNRFSEAPATAAPPLHRPDPALEAAQLARLRALRDGRDGPRARATLGELRVAASGTGNLFPALLTAVKARATLGEIADVLRGVFGEYRPA